MNLNELTAAMNDFVQSKGWYMMLKVRVSRPRVIWLSR